MKIETERRLLQTGVAMGCLVPIFGGLTGVVSGAGMLGHAGDVSLDSHMRYLSGLLFAIGVGFASTIPTIERHSTRIRLLGAIIVSGGVARAYGIAVDGLPSSNMLFALGMELAVVPFLCIWQRRIVRRMNST